MDTTFFLLAIIIVWTVLLFLATQTWFRIKNPEIGLFYMLFRTQKFSNFIDKLSKKGRYIWLVIFDTGIIVALGILIASSVMFIINFIKFLFILAVRIGLISYSGNPADNIQTVDVIPAIPLLSISVEVLPYFILAVLLGAVFHELFHGVAARLAGIKLKSTGVFIFLLFFGAFVEPDEEEMKSSNNRTKMRVAAAGAMANVLLCILIFTLILQPVFIGTISLGYETEPSGAMVLEVTPDEPAELNGIKPNWVIIRIDNTTIDSYVKFHEYATTLQPNQTIMIEFYRHDTIALETSTHPNNQSRGFVGVSAWDFHKPKFEFLPLQFPYIYLNFLFYTFSINLMLALINLLPIPMLDGDMLIGALLDSRIENSKGVQKIIRWSIGLIFLANFVLTITVSGWTTI